MIVKNERICTFYDDSDANDADDEPDWSVEGPSAVVVVGGGDCDCGRFGADCAGDG
jgi:hypothetical protein